MVFILSGSKFLSAESTAYICHTGLGIHILALYGAGLGLFVAKQMVEANDGTKKENDNDFHLILSSSADTSSAKFMTAEITGIPKGGPFRDKLINPRRQFKKFFSDHLPGTNYKKYSPPIPVEVTGPLFYDIDHPA